VQGIRTPAGNDTTSEPQGRNALPGAPVKASMSGSRRSNQGGTVEYCNYCIPPLIFFRGWVFFIPSPMPGKNKMQNPKYKIISVSVPQAHHHPVF